MENDEVSSKILSLTFNENYECFICGTAKGFHIFTSSPFDLSFYRDLDTGIRLVEMLQSTNILAFVGVGNNPRFPPTRVILWDDNITKSIGELDFNEEVRALRLRKDRLAVIFPHKIYLYTIPELKICEIFETYYNPRGVFEFSINSQLITLSLGMGQGIIRIRNYDEQFCVEKEAHVSAIACLALSPNAEICATASEKGTLIRLFSVRDGELIKELRRGVTKALIYSLCFDMNNKWLLCASDKGTVHIFSVDNLTSQDTINKRSKLRFIKWMIGYFGSEWSFAQFRLNIKNTKVGFGEDNKIIAISRDGYYYSTKFDPIRGGECRAIEKAYMF